MQSVRKQYITQNLQTNLQYPRTNMYLNCITKVMHRKNLTHGQEKINLASTSKRIKTQYKHLIGQILSEKAQNSSSNKYGFVL